MWINLSRSGIRGLQSEWPIERTCRSYMSMSDNPDFKLYLSGQDDLNRCKPSCTSIDYEISQTMVILFNNLYTIYKWYKLYYMKLSIPISISSEFKEWNLRWTWQMITKVRLTTRLLRVMTYVYSVMTPSF